jgi:hypothetical protein
MPWGLREAVGLTDEGAQCPNHASDQQQVAELLDAVGLPLLLAVSTHEVFELPESAAPSPSLSYTLRGQVAAWDGPGIHMELWVNGPLKVAWSQDSYNLGCEVSPEFKALDEAVASGSARAIGGVALDQLCSRLRSESRGAIGSLFAAVSIGTGLDGTPRIGGTIGDDTSFLRVEFDPVERTVIYTGSVHVFKSHPVTQGEAQVSGDLQVQLRITTSAEDEAASVATALAVLAIGAVFLAPTAAWVGSGIVSGLGTGVGEIIVRVPLRALAHP